MSLLTSSSRFRPSTPSQAKDVAGNQAQDDQPRCPADSIVESTEAPCDSPAPTLAPLPPEHQVADITAESSASNENKQILRYVRPDALPMVEPASSLRYIYTPLRLTHPDVRPPSAMEHRTRLPSPDIKTPILGQNAALFGRLESHGKSTYTSEPPQLEELDPRDPQDEDILQFSDERPMAPNRRLDVDRLQGRGQPTSTVRAVQKGA